MSKSQNFSVLKPSKVATFSDPVKSPNSGRTYLAPFSRVLPARENCCRVSHCFFGGMLNQRKPFKCLETKAGRKKQNYKVNQRSFCRVCRSVFPCFLEFLHSNSSYPFNQLFMHEIVNKIIRVRQLHSMLPTSDSQFRHDFFIFN